jgi:gamma-glutamylcyclotransferase (GGCT)/AIG2-like uncharacterized protein YtfP
MLYFAYGANLHRGGMKRRCPAARPLGAAVLQGYRLCFRRFADIVADPGGRVLGVVWDLTPACERALDTFEGEDYRKITVEVVQEDKTVSAMAYMMRVQQRTAPPSMDYYREVALGYRDWGFDETMLRRARYDVLHVGPGAANATTAAVPSAPKQGRRRALWDPAAQGAGDIDDLLRKK